MQDCLSLCCLSLATETCDWSVPAFAGIFCFFVSKRFFLLLIRNLPVEAYPHFLVGASGTVWAGSREPQLFRFMLFLPCFRV